MTANDPENRPSSTPELPQLPEKDFINESYSKNPWPLWLWFFLLTALIALLWGVGNWYSDKINILLTHSPFLQVTNRDMSLYLWQNPESMRINAKEKNGYLPGFQYIDKVTVDLAASDQYAVGPPELFFRYHTWKRLLYSEFSERAIPRKEFQDFLTYAQEWHPSYWPNAPKQYRQMVDGLSSSTVDNLTTLSLDTLPIEVRMAFVGWKNYFQEGDAINSMQPTQQQMREFINVHPDYARNYWRNVVMNATPNYLKILMKPSENKDSIVPVDDMTSFLRVAFYNYIMGQKEQVSTSKPATK